MSKSVPMRCYDLDRITSNELLASRCSSKQAMNYLLVDADELLASRCSSKQAMNYLLVDAVQNKQ